MSTAPFKIILAAENKEGPISRYFFSLARQLVAIGYSVTILVDEFKVEKPYQENNGLAVNNWPTRRGTKLKDAIFLARLIKQEKPDALIGNFGSVNIMLLVGYFMGVKNRFAWYHTLSTQQRLDFTGSKWKFRFLVFRKQMVYRFATGIIANSEGAADNFRSTYDPGKKVLALPLLIGDPKGEALTENLVEPEETYITFIGRLAPSKDQFTAIRAMKHVIPHLPDLKLKLLGDGMLKEQLKQYANYAGVLDHCQFLGHQSHATVFSILNNSRINLCTSIDEAFGLVNIQALGMGVPVIGTNVGGIKDIVKDGWNGILIEVRDEKALAGKILNLLNNKKLHQIIAKQARHDFELHYLLDEEKLNKQCEQIEAMLEH